jgi:hypothetical protein
VKDWRGDGVWDEYNLADSRDLMRHSVPKRPNCKWSCSMRQHGLFKFSFPDASYRLYNYINFFLSLLPFSRMCINKFSERK